MDRVAPIKTCDILCFGEPMVEFNQQADGRFLMGHGGDVSNCAIAAARSGARAAVFTRLGTDAFGDSLMALYRAEGVDASTILRDEDAPTGVYVVTHGAEGHRFSYLRSGSAASRVCSADLPAAAISGAEVLHVSGISQAISQSGTDAVFAAIDVARKTGVKVSYDTNLRARLWPLDRARAIIHATVGMADIVLPGLDDARLLTGLDDPDAITDAYLALGAGMVALTLGADGALVATARERRRIPARRVEALDATGAGDTFDGAFLAEIVAGRDPFAAGHYANAAAALSTLGYGAVEPMPRRAEVEAFIASA